MLLTSTSRKAAAAAAVVVLCTLSISSHRRSSAGWVFISRSRGAFPRDVNGTPVPVLVDTHQPRTSVRINNGRPLTATLKRRKKKKARLCNDRYARPLCNTYGSCWSTVHEIGCDVQSKEGLSRRSWRDMPSKRIHRHIPVCLPVCQPARLPSLPQCVAASCPSFQNRHLHEIHTDQHEA